MNAGAFLAIWGAAIVVAWIIGANKGKPGTGFVLGLLLSWIGVIIALVMSPSHEATNAAQGRRPCPYCSEGVLPTATVCPHCQRTITAERLPEPARGTKEQWLADPSGRHPDRWWDGANWTQWVRDAPGGTRSEDPPIPA